MPSPKDKVTCIFCGRLMQLSHGKQITEGKKSLYRQYWHCKHCLSKGQYIDGKDKAECIKKMRVTRSVKNAQR